MTCVWTGKYQSIRALSSSPWSLSHYHGAPNWVFKLIKKGKCSGNEIVGCYIRWICLVIFGCPFNVDFEKNHEKTKHVGELKYSFHSLEINIFLTSSPELVVSPTRDELESFWILSSNKFFENKYNCVMIGKITSSFRQANISNLYLKKRKDADKFTV